MSNPNAKLGTNPSDWTNTIGNVLNFFGGAATITSKQARGPYTGPLQYAANIKNAKIFGAALGTVGLLITAADIRVNGFTASNVLDATFGVVSFIGLPGAIVGTVYFVGNIAIKAGTGQTIGEHADNYLDRYFGN